MGDVSKHFSRSEFACNCGLCPQRAVDSELLTLLEGLREYFLQEVTITSGWRCEAHNKAVGGLPASKHLEGIAADIIVNGTPPDKVHYYLDKTYPDEMGLGKYSKFTHIDVRDHKARWSSP